MNKTFNEIEEGDKVYRIEIKNSLLESEPGVGFITNVKARSIRKVKYLSSITMSVVFDDNTVIYPRAEMSSHMFRNSVDTTVYKKLNTYVYGTTKRACIEAAIKVLSDNNAEQKKTWARLGEILETNKVTLDVLDKELENADIPDTALEFAEMAL